MAWRVAIVLLQLRPKPNQVGPVTALCHNRESAYEPSRRFAQPPFSFAFALHGGGALNELALEWMTGTASVTYQSEVAGKSGKEKCLAVFVARG